MMKVRDLADEMRVSPATVKRWASNGALQGLRTPGGHWRFADEEVSRLKRAMERAALPSGPQAASDGASGERTT